MNGLKTETKALVIDFSKVHSIDEYRELITKHCNGLDIAMAFLNAGIVVEGPIDLVTDSDLQDVYTTNGLHVVYMTKVLLEDMQNRKQRSAIVVTSSGLARVAVPGIMSYCSTKVLVSRFCESIAQEVNVDVMAWEAGGIITKMNDKPMSLTAPTAVKACFSKIGYETRTRGHWWHEVQSLMFSLVYMPLFGRMIADSMRKTFQAKRR